ncbi:MAG TPA: glycosyltransferase [Gaiellaceae bacterium]|nr:glycosyltransferase [Gaiellaceae bacterium]
MRPFRIGVYTDLVFRREDAALSTDLSFILFVSGLASRLGELVFLGRLDDRPGRAPYRLPDEIELVPLPHYERVTDVRGVLRSVRRARAALLRELDRLDALWLFGPHPLALVFARLALRRGTPVFLGIRQDFPRYIGGRLPSRAWLWALPVAHGLELAFRRLARRVPTVVVGPELGRVYGRQGGPLLETTVSLVRREDIVSLDEPLARSWDGDLPILSVGRLESEKNPLLLPEALAELRRRCDRWRLVVVGTGPLRDAVEARARALGVDDALELRGYVPFGDELWSLYRSSAAFLHVSLTEGLPQVLLEAQAAGLPVVATDVGGVRAALGDGRHALVVPPRDPRAIVDALERLRLDEQLRRRLVAEGLASVAERTLDAELDRVAAFFRGQLGTG